MRRSSSGSGCDISHLVTQALFDLQSIRDYIAHDSPRYADLVVHRLVADEAIREVIVRPYRIVTGYVLASPRS
jgi:hypothetical protein